MNLDHPTVEFHFVYAMTFCKVKVYNTEKDLLQKILDALDVEFVDASSSETFSEVDTSLLLSMVNSALPSLAWRLK